MAELVGDAYIRITADTAAMNRSLARAMKQSGKAGAAEYVDSFGGEVDRIADQRMAGARKSFASALVDPKEFDKMAKNFDSVESAAAHWRKELLRLSRQQQVTTDEYKEFKKAINDWSDGAVKARDAAKKLNDEHFEALSINKRLADSQRQLRLVYERDHAEALRMVREASAQRKMILSRDHAEALQMQASFNKKAETAQKNSLNNFFANQTSNLNAITKAREDAYKAQIIMDRDHHKALRMLDEEHTRQVKKEAAERHRLLGGDYRVFAKLYRNMDKLSSGFGRAFGKGSRNNFVNFVGSMVGGFAKIGSSIIQIPFKMFDNFREGFMKAGVENASMLGKLGAGFMAMFGSAGPWGLIAGLAAVTLGLSGLGAVLPGLVSLLGLTATAFASLLGAVSYGLTAAMLAAAPAAVGLAAGLGGLFSVINEFVADKKNKKFMDDFKKPLEDFNKSHYPEVEKFLTSVKGGFKTLFDDISPSVTAFFTSWKKNMTDPSTKAGLGVISDSIGRIATTFNTALPNLLSGLVGFFQPILPYAEKLATAIGNAFKAFDKWANSKGGRDAIGDFMEKAWVDAKLVWEILKDIGSIIGSVFDFGNEQGTGFLEGIHGWLKKISDYLKDPANKGKIEQWFAKAKDIGSDIGKLVTGVGDIVSTLSSEQGQADAKQFMETMGKLAGHANTLATALTIISATSGLGVVSDFFKEPEEGKKPEGFSASTFNQASKDLNAKLTEMWNTAVENTKQWAIDMWTEVETFFTELPGKVSTWFSETVTSIQTGFQEGGTAIIDGVARWLEDFATGIENFDLSAWMLGVLVNIGTFFTGLGDQIGTGLGIARTSISTWISDTWNDFTNWGLGVLVRIGQGVQGIPAAIGAFATQAYIAILTWVNSSLAAVQTWAQGVPARIQAGIAAAGAFLSALPGKVAAWLSSLPERLSGPFRRGWDKVNEYFNGAPGRLAAAAGRVISAIGGALSGVWNAITSPFRRAWEEVQRIVRMIGSIRIPTPKMPSIDLTPWNAAGNIYSGPTVIGVGEAGPEAVVPLDRPLSMVNPSVRSMSAILQSMTGGRGGDGAGFGGPKVNFEAGAFNINLPTGDPQLAAEAVLDRLVAYIG